MNQQPFVYGGFYLHYENRLYRLITFAFNKNIEDALKVMAIYQPQYDSPKLGKNKLYALESDSFLEDVKIRNITVPRFEHLGNSEERVRQIIRAQNIKIKPSPVFKKESVLDQNLSEIIAEHYVIKGFAQHAETNETQIIYALDNIPILSIISKEKFLKKTGIDSSNAILARYQNI